MKPGNRDPETLETGLEEIEAALRKLPAAEPPELVDQAVLNRARAAVEGHTQRPWNFGWMHALATAAIVVLGVAILMQEPVPPEEPLRVALPPSGKLRDIDSEVKPLRIPADSAQARRQAAEQERASSESRLVREVQIHVPAPASVTPPAAKSLATAADNSGLAQQAATESDASPMADEALASGEEMKKEMPLDPQTWIVRMLELKQQGKAEQLRQELAAFRSAYPSHILPPELSDG